jgi:hypothetical protein
MGLGISNSVYGFYPKNNPSGFITGVDLSSYATIANVNAVSGALQTQINNISGGGGSGVTGDYYPNSNPSGFITGVNLSSYITTGQTGTFYPASNPSGFITGVDTSLYVTKLSGQFTNRPTVNGTGVLLSGEIPALPNTIVYTTGNQTISGNKTFSASRCVFSGANVIFVDNTGIVSGQWQFSNQPTVNGTGVLLSGNNLIGSPVEYIAALSDETSDLTTGLAKFTFRAPVAFKLTNVAGSVNTSPSGSAIVIDINNDTNSALSTKLSIDSLTKTSFSAATGAVINSTYENFPIDREITIDIDQIGAARAGKGLKVTLRGVRS